jgi:Uma2 family endonuclease
MAPQVLMTAAEFDALPREEGVTLELLNGEVIERMSANYEHNRLLVRAGGKIGSRLEEMSWGDVIPTTDFMFGEHRLCPDIALINARNAARADRRRVPVRVIPDIAIEIASPSETAPHLETKVAAYLENGVLEVWVFFLDPRRVYVHSLDQVRRLRPGDILTTPAVPGLELDLDSLYANL